MNEYDVQLNLQRYLKSELQLRGINSEKLSLLLSESGFLVSKAAVDNRLSRASFSAAFYLQCLKVIGCNYVDFERIFNVKS
jgi:hypothetical protein